MSLKVARETRKKKLTKWQCPDGHRLKESNDLDGLWCRKCADVYKKSGRAYVPKK